MLSREFRLKNKICIDGIPWIIGDACEDNRTREQCGLSEQDVPTLNCSKKPPRGDGPLHLGTHGVNVKTLYGSIWGVPTHSTNSVDALKTLMAERCGVPADRQRLLYAGEMTPGHASLEQYEINVAELR